MATTLRLKPLGLRQHLATLRSNFYPHCSLQTRRHASSHSHSLPKIADTSVWTSMIPRFIRERKSKDRKSKEWNPATFYIVMFTLIGSQAIRMLSLKNSYATYSRTADAKIELLKEVIGRIQSGEKVDVERLLGTGDEAKEREWEDVLREIEQEDDLWQQKRSKEAKAESEGEKKVDEGQVKVQSKESVAPTKSAEGAEKEPVKAQSSRKLNFF